MQHEDKIWLAKLDARLHDPIEKALILMRTGQSHEAGTSLELRRKFGLDRPEAAIRQAVKQADHWASAMDRAAFPQRDQDGRYPKWQQVRFDKQPVIIHPLTGDAFDLKKLEDIDPDEVQEQATSHLRRLVDSDDPKRTGLAFWRFGPDIDAPGLRNLWRLLPADTRVPDHTIHDHRDLASALAGSFAADPEGGPALLAVSLGPVQDFISQARSTSDLWAGSHLLSRLAWEAMKVICNRLGPEAILFPRLRGIPLVDLWLQTEQGLDEALFEDMDWRNKETDANPLMAAALPNRFTALVPANQARALAEEITTEVRGWVRTQACNAFRELLAAAGRRDEPDRHGFRQIEEQLKEFPQVHWAVVPWSLIETDSEGKVDASRTRLSEAMQPYFESDSPGFLGTRSWSLISRGLELEKGYMPWKPNPGALYPALSELLERTLAAVKSVRRFEKSCQQGWRDTLSGEVEWLTDDDPDSLRIPPGERTDTVWAEAAKNNKTLIKAREHLGAANTLKRMWPRLFLQELSKTIALDLDRFVVSTHAMALSGSISRAVDANRKMPEKLAKALKDDDSPRVALPSRLAGRIRKRPEPELLFKLSGWVDRQRESEDESSRRAADSLLHDYFGDSPENYYSLLLMDGDQMGAWMSAARDKTRPNLDSFHPQIRNTLKSSFSDDHNFLAYAEEKRAANPARHMLISDALNNFAIRLAPKIVEGHRNGRILYAGGDDLMAMLPVIDLLPAMGLLRAAYSGVPPSRAGIDEAGESNENPAFELESGSNSANGFIKYNETKHKNGKELLRMMGEKATASCGAVIAHYKAPLAAVLRELREAESRAKNQGGRDAFSLTIVKRSGGALRLTAKFGEPLRLLLKLRDFLAEPDVSRRAVYHSTVWLRDLPEPQPGDELLPRMLAWQLRRQTANKDTANRHHVEGLASRLVDQAGRHAKAGKQRQWVENFLSTAEFLARETRAGTASQPLAAYEQEQPA